MRYKQRIGTVYQAPTPCLDCENRSIGCHGSCNDYINFKSKQIKRYNKLSESLLVV